MFAVIRVAVCGLLVTSPALAQVVLPDGEVREVINFYRASKQNDCVLPAAVSDAVFRAGVHRQLPNYKFLRDPSLIEALSQVFQPVLSHCRRENVYDILIVDSPTPMVMADSGVILAVSTGMIERAESDDELLGYVAHEVGHEYYAKYSVYTNHLLRLVMLQGKEPVLRVHLTQLLTLIELQCDVYAALMLVELGYDPLSFIRSIEQTRPTLPNQLENHPADFQRRLVVEAVTPVRVKPRQSDAFRKLKKLEAGRQFVN